ncbi:MAG: ABC transporter permease [Pseudomonadota bacterium]
MNHTLNQIVVIARRDFMAVVATPTFLLFLLAPFFMLGISVASGFGGAYLAKSSVSKRQMVAIVSPADTTLLTANNEAVRKRLYGPGNGLADLHIAAPEADISAQQAALFASKDIDVTAILRGPLTAPVITHQKGEDRSARFLATLSEETLRAQRLGGSPNTLLSAAKITEIVQKVPTKSRQQKTGFGAVVVIFILTLMLASQAVGMMAEEKSNKVLEILAAAVPLEAVFFGKLVGLFGVALLFVAFWGTLAAVGASFIPPSLGLIAFAPTIGLVPFVILGACYFAMAYMLLGAVFLGIGAQASTMREIQMLSLPITIIQMAMFGLASAAANNPDSTIARVAEIFPFSSPFAMAAHGATDPALWPHMLALGWQGLWVALTIWLAARLFRAGVLNSGGGFWAAFARHPTTRSAKKPA